MGLRSKKPTVGPTGTKAGILHLQQLHNFSVHEGDVCVFLDGGDVVGLKGVTKAGGSEELFGVGKNSANCFYVWCLFCFQRFVYTNN